jgi:hypothetical protein
MHSKTFSSAGPVPKKRTSLPEECDINDPILGKLEEYGDADNAHKFEQPPGAK